MYSDLTETQSATRKKVRQFARDNLDPVAQEIDSSQRTPPEVISAIAQTGWLGSGLPQDWGGGGLDPISYGLVIEEVGRACSSVRSLMTVHNMATHALLRFGNEDQRQQWLPALCAGEKIIAFALTEPDTSGATGDVRTTARADGANYVLNGEKTWITYGQVADQFLVFALDGEHPIALLLERGMAGFSVEPISDALGTRGSMLAHLKFDGVRIDASHKVGATGAGINFVANTAIDHGRYSVAWGAAGIARACLEASALRAAGQEEGRAPLIDHQLVQRRLTNILVNQTTAYALCMRAGHFRQAGDARAASETALAKYHAADAASKAATDTVAIHGGNGCSSSFPAARYLRDATVLNIIEGTPEMHQIGLASYVARKIHAEG